MDQIFAQIAQLFKKYSTGQRILIVLIFVGIISAIISLLLWANRPEYELLHSELSPNKASKIVSELKDKGVKYKLEANGTTIKVPSEKVNELKLEFAEKGYLGEDIKGYKVFDESKIGMTTFMQRLNMKRALEGELSKTIDKFPEVKSSRVHLVLPKDKLFEDKGGGKASVVLYLGHGQYLNDNQVRGIASLVANSVDGINASDVAVLDSEGNLLSNSEDDESNVLSATSNQWNLRHQVEQKLKNKVARLVEGVVGKGNTKVQVSAELNMEKLEQTIEEVDPENLAIVSEERQIESQTNKDSLNNTNQQHTRENVITNYETNKKITHHVHSTGDIKRLSVAVLVDGTYQQNEQQNEKKYIPRSQEEMQQITQLVKSAVGFDQSRGDIVEVRNLKFSRTQLEEDQKYFQQQERKNLINNLINKGLIIIGIIVAFFLIRNMIKNSPDIMEISTSPEKAALASDSQQYLASAEEGEEEEEVDEDVFIKKLSPEAKAKLEAKRKMLDSVSEFAESEPEEAAQMLRAWIQEKG
jgi:flagellar M-ring protein FliF